MSADRDTEGSGDFDLLQAVADDDGVIENDDGTRTVYLEVPIQIIKKPARRGEPEETEDVGELVFRRPTAKDWLETDKEKGDLAKNFRLAAKLCGLSYANFLALDGADAIRCTQVANTMGKKLPTGA